MLPIAFFVSGKNSFSSPALFLERRGMSSLFKLSEVIEEAQLQQRALMTG